MKLLPKQKKFADKYLETGNATESAAQAYNIKSKRHTAEVIGYENLRKPEIKSYLAAHSKTIEDSLYNTFNEYKEEEDINKRKHSTELGMWMHDKIHGKATQRIEQHSTSVNLNLDLTNITSQNEH